VGSNQRLLLTFANAIGTFESALVTFARVEIEPSRLRLHCENAQAVVEFDPESTGVRDVAPGGTSCQGTQTCTASCSPCEVRYAPGRYRLPSRSRVPDLL